MKNFSQMFEFWSFEFRKDANSSIFIQNSILLTKLKIGSSKIRSVTAAEIITNYPMISRIFYQNLS